MNTLLPLGQWVFIASAVNSATQNQSGFRYTLPSTSTQTIVFNIKTSTGGLFYDLAPNVSVLLGGNSFGLYYSCNCDLQYARVYVNYFPNSSDEYINLALMNTGNIKLSFYS